MDSLPSFTLTVNVGALSASEADAVSLHDFPQFPERAHIEHAVIRNNSAANITIQSQPGSPVIDPGERVELHDLGHAIVLVPDAAVLDGELRVTFEVVWD